MSYIFESERLGFRSWRESDRKLLRQMGKDKDVMEYFPSLLTDRESDIFLDKINKHFIDKGFGLWPVELKDTGEFIGFIGLLEANFESDFTPCVEIGWRIRKEFWGKGYGTEGARRVLDYGFEKLDLDEIYSFTSILNTRSENLMKKLGMEKVLYFDHPHVEDGHRLKRHVLYKIGRKKES